MDLMQMLKLESWHSSADRHRFKIVRTDNCTDVPGEIIFADDATGECTIYYNGETKALNFGVGGIKIIKKGY